MTSPLDENKNDTSMGVQQSNISSENHLQGPFQILCGSRTLETRKMNGATNMQSI